MPESAEDIVRKSGATFNVIHDPDYAIMCAYGTAFEMPKAQRSKLKLIGLNVDKANGNEEGVLPVPATFIIGTDGRIKALHFDANYKERMSVKAILESL
jgi:peroxiredoxin